MNKLNNIYILKRQLRLIDIKDDYKFHRVYLTIISINQNSFKNKDTSYMIIMFIMPSIGTITVVEMKQYQFYDVRGIDLNQELVTI